MSKLTMGGIGFQLAILVTLIVIAIGVMPDSESETKLKFEDAILMEIEHAYFKGQSDYLDGDIRVAKDSHGRYVWVRSCWDDGTAPLWKPSLEDPKTEYDD